MKLDWQAWRGSCEMSTSLFSPVINISVSFVVFGNDIQENNVGHLRLHSSQINFDGRKHSPGIKEHTSMIYSPAPILA